MGEERVNLYKLQMLTKKRSSTTECLEFGAKLIIDELMKKSGGVTIYIFFITPKQAFKYTS